MLATIMIGLSNLETDIKQITNNFGGVEYPFTLKESIFYIDTMVPIQEIE